VQNLRLLLPAVVIAAVLAVSCSKKEEPPAKTADTSDSAKPGWLTSYEQAQKEALTGNKLLLMDFTGSDWCGWCIALDKEVFSKPEFKEYAKKNLVLLELDFPKRKKMPVDTAKQNQRLAMKYQIMAFPTVVVLNGSGQVVGALGYVPGGPSAWIAELEKLRNG
jgi:thioredoxin-related protein